MSSLSEQAQNMLSIIPETGSIGNVTLRKKFAGFEGDFSEAKAELISHGLIKLGRGKGGSVRRVELAPVSDVLEAVRAAALSSPVTEQDVLVNPIDGVTVQEEF